MAISRVNKFHNEITVLDFETTGLVASSCNVIQVAVTTFKDGQLVDSYNAYIRHFEPLSQKITELTGITNELLAREGQSRLDVFTKLVRDLEGKFVVGHNLKFDIDFLRKEVVDLGLEVPNFTYDDTLLLVKKHFKFGNNKLEFLKQLVGEDNRNSHDALNDCIMTGKLYYWIYDNKDTSIEIEYSDGVMERLKNLLALVENGFELKEDVYRSLKYLYKDELEELASNYHMDKERPILSKMFETVLTLNPSAFTITYPEKKHLIESVKLLLPSNVGTVDVSDKAIWWAFETIGYLREKETSKFLTMEEMSKVQISFIKMVVDRFKLDIQAVTDKETKIGLDDFLKEYLPTQTELTEPQQSKVYGKIMANTHMVNMLEEAPLETKSMLIQRVISQMGEELNEVNNTQKERFTIQHRIRDYLPKEIILEPKKNKLMKNLSQQEILLSIQNINTGRNIKLNNSDIQTLLFVLLPNVTQEFEPVTVYRLLIPELVREYLPDRKINFDETMKARTKRILTYKKQLEQLNLQGFRFQVREGFVKGTSNIFISHDKNKNYLIEVSVYGITLFKVGKNGTNRIWSNILTCSSPTLIAEIKQNLPPIIMKVFPNKSLAVSITNEIARILDLRVTNIPSYKG